MRDSLLVERASKINVTTKCDGDGDFKAKDHSASSNIFGTFYNVNVAAKHWKTVTVTCVNLLVVKLPFLPILLRLLVAVCVVPVAPRLPGCLVVMRMGAVWGPLLRVVTVERCVLFVDPFVFCFKFCSVF